MTDLPIINKLTNANLSNFEQAFEFCKFIDDAWTDGFDFKGFEYNG